MAQIIVVYKCALVGEGEANYECDEEDVEGHLESLHSRLIQDGIDPNLASVEVVTEHWLSIV